MVGPSKSFLLPEALAAGVQLLTLLPLLHWVKDVSNIFSKMGNPLEGKKNLLLKLLMPWILILAELPRKPGKGH